MTTHDDPAFGLANIGQIAVPVGDVDRAIAFYRDVLGMRFLFKAPPGLGFFECNGVRLLLDQPAGATAEQRSSIIYFKVADIQAAHAALTARGGRLPASAAPGRAHARLRAVDGLLP